MIEPAHTILVLTIVYATSEGSGEPAHPCDLARASKVYVTCPIDSCQWITTYTFFCHAGMFYYYQNVSTIMGCIWNSTRCGIYACKNASPGSTLHVFVHVLLMDSRHNDYLATNSRLRTV